jgi:N-acetylneuraminic acid mutarotase
MQPVTWVDSKGNLWLFGGDGADSESSQVELNDLWRYQP